MQNAPVELLRRYDTNFIREHNHPLCLVIFARIAMKVEKFGPIFSSFNFCPSLPSVVKYTKKTFQLLKIA